MASAEADFFFLLAVLGTGAVVALLVFLWALVWTISSAWHLGAGWKRTALLERETRKVWESLANGWKDETLISRTKETIDGR